ARDERAERQNQRQHNVIDEDRAATQIEGRAVTDAYVLDASRSWTRNFRSFRLGRHCCLHQILSAVIPEGSAKWFRPNECGRRCRVRAAVAARGGSYH